MARSRRTPAGTAGPNLLEQQSVQSFQNDPRFDNDLKKDVIGRHVRSSSDPLSRGGNFSLDGAIGAHLLDSEPNPFEQSFGPEPVHSRSKEGNSGTLNTNNPPGSARKARSISPNELIPRATPGGTQKLPPLSMIQTPGTELSQFGWNVDSLRTGPLSPALLNGPNYTTGTGLTPFVTGANQPGGPVVSFPPPSPATAALFAMMTNNTPGTADAAAANSGLQGGGPRPHEGVNEGNHFEASFARASETGGGQGNHVQVQPTPLNGIHRAALANQLSGLHSPQRSIAPQSMQSNNFYNQPSQNPSNFNFPSQPAQQQQPQQFGNHNPLYLLSQASSHNDDAVVAAAALSGLATPGGFGHDPAALAALQQAQSQSNGVVPNLAGPLRGAATSSAGQSNSPSDSSLGATNRDKKLAGANKRKKGNNPSESGDAGSKPSAGKKGKRAAAKIFKDELEDDEMLDEDDEIDQMMSPRPHNPNETEDDKRKNFLERNRQAALKCRQRKKAWLANLQYKVESLTTDNETLVSTVTNLKEEIQSLRAILQAHANCPVAATTANGRH